MAANDFFSRWSRRKQEAAESAGLQHAAPVPPTETGATSDRPVPAAPAGSQEAAPTLADVGKLTAESDYSSFLRQDVDEAIRRSAMKKLFAHPHIKFMDGLDIYIDDYNKTTPIPSAMLAALEQSKAFLAPLNEETEAASSADAATLPRQEELTEQGRAAQQGETAQEEATAAIFHGEKSPDVLRDSGSEETEGTDRQAADQPDHFPASIEQKDGAMPRPESKR